MSRQVPAALIRDQIDLYSSGITRQTGVVVSAMSAKLFWNNSLMAWPVQAGAAVQDASISAGAIYFHEISGSPGFYAIRFFPDRVGYWRLVLTCSSPSAEIVREYDVVNPSSSSSGGLVASFTAG